MPARAVRAGTVLDKTGAISAEAAEEEEEAEAEEKEKKEKKKAAAVDQSW